MYEEHFGLSAKPFQLSPDARFFFPSKEHRRALSFLQYGLDQADGFIVITGDVGTGKTTLVQALLANIDTDDLLVATLVTTQLKEDDLLQLVANKLGLRISGESKALLLRDLESLFRQRALEQKRVLLIVDEAQNLPPRSVEELRMLSNFQMDGKPLVQVFLLGQEEFRATLLSEGFEQLRQRVIATYHLSPLEEAETRTYIEHRLTRAGWNHRPAFVDDAFSAIFSFSDGVPRRINNLCDRLLLYAFLEEVETIDASVVESVSKEIGTEFWGGKPGAVKGSDTQQPAIVDGPVQDGSQQQIFDTPGQPLETMARFMFDKANVQQRLSSLERALDTMGHSLKDLHEIKTRLNDIDTIKTEMSFIRLLLEELVDKASDRAVHVSGGLDEGAGSDASDASDASDERNIDQSKIDKGDDSEGSQRLA